MYSFLAIILSLPFLVSRVQAATTGPGPNIPTTQNAPVNAVAFIGPFANETVESVLSRLADYATVIAASVAMIMILYGAFQILTSRGDEKMYKAGRTTIIHALGGLIVALVARGLVSLFATLVRNLGIGV